MGEKKKRGWFGRKAKEKASDKAQKSGMFGGYRTRQEQLDAMERGYGLQKAPVSKNK